MEHIIIFSSWDRAEGLSSLDTRKAPLTMTALLSAAHVGLKGAVASYMCST